MTESKRPLPIKIIAYRCPYCSHISVDMDEIEDHSSHCRKNPNYTKKCIECTCLHDNFILRSLNGKNPCNMIFMGGQCIYMNHDDSDVTNLIRKHHSDYEKFCKEA